MTEDMILMQKIDTLTDLIRSADSENYPTALDQVQALRMIAETAQSALRQAVPAARAEGATWDQIGRALDVSRQSAHERYA